MYDTDEITNFFRIQLYRYLDVRVVEYRDQHIEGYQHCCDVKGTK